MKRYNNIRLSGWLCVVIQTLEVPCTPLCCHVGIDNVCATQLCRVMFDYQHMQCCVSADIVVLCFNGSAKAKAPIRFSRLASPMCMYTIMFSLNSCAHPYHLKRGLSSTGAHSLNHGFRTTWAGLAIVFKR